MKVGDFIDALYKKTTPDGKEVWELCESKITMIVQNTKKNESIY